MVNLKTISVNKLKAFHEVEEDCSLKTKSGRIICPPDRYKSGGSFAKQHSFQYLIFFLIFFAALKII